MSRSHDVSTKFTSISKLSGEVTASLSGLDSPAAIEAYSRIQVLEADAVKAATTQQVTTAAAKNAIEKLDAARKQVRLLNAACVDICQVQGIVSAEYFTVVDKGDDAGLAKRLEPEIRHVPGYGPALADTVAHLVRDLHAAETACIRAKSALITAQRELDSALLNLQSAVAQGRAVLAAFGVKLARKPAKRKAPTSTNDSDSEVTQPTLVITAA